MLLFVRFIFSRYPLLTCIYYLLIQSYLAIPTLSPPSTPVLVSVSLLYCEVASISIGYILRLELLLAVLIGHDLALYINSQYSTVDQFSSRSVLLALQITRTKCQEPRFSTTPRHPKPAKNFSATQNPQIVLCTSEASPCRAKEHMMVSTGVEPATLACRVSDDISTTL